ncbi:MAG: sulfite exporter TauE/SafE family protein [Bacteroidetes bacterium]|nr:sulfite exporter TauE/SafE family protein [Bacteroidota bacterium]MBL0064755.1 sulfite exporter TauE/SafE family protein [Bacteroidota bacterium]MBL0137286.1 sulfite exporter TauE/SafE family protein [Bacteroidota bacterium]
MLVILGYILAVLIGLSLGLIGGGGSILTVPVLVYCTGIAAVPATSYSLFVVGVTSAVGAANYARKDLIHIRTALLFGIPSIIVVYIMRHFIVPLLPETFFTLGNWIFTKNIFILILFAILMIVASISMIRKKVIHEQENTTHTSKDSFRIFLQGIGVGIITGLVGAGGGFLIVPALVFLARLPIKIAIGTSLLIIASNALIGFIGDYGHQIIDWRFLAIFSGLAIAGMFIGTSLSRKIDNRLLRPLFGWFVLAMGIYILIRETL